MAATIVVDASVGVALVSPDESVHLAATERYAALLAANGTFVTTSFYAFEVGNVLSRSKRKEPAAERFDEACGLAVPVALAQAGLHRALTIAMDGKLSFYDAAYLALAEQEDATLWTEDKEILKRFPGRSASTAELARKRAP